MSVNKARSAPGVRGVLVLPLVGLVLGIAAIDGRSLWTDEIGTWELTQWASWSSWAQAFWHHYNSDGQLPVYHAFMRAWVLIAGDSERALRWSNVPWLILALWGLARTELPGLARGWPVVAMAASHAFVWYYLNEARPYILYLAGASWMTAGMTRLLQSRMDTLRVDSALRECLVGSCLLIAGTILGVFWVFSSLMALSLYPTLLRALLASIRRQWPLFVASLLLSLCVAGVAVHSHLSGARANQTAAFSLAGMGYGLIELLGMAGLGPSRNDLRVSVLTADRWQLGLMCGAALLASFCVLRAWLLLPAVRLRVAVAVAVGLPLLVMALLGLGLHWRVVGRHLSAVLPVLLLGMVVFLGAAWDGRLGVSARVVGVTLMLSLAASTLSVRLAPRHMKDDYRQAATWAREALGRGRTVLWLADQRGLRYYGLSRDRSNPVLAPIPGLIPFARYPDVAKHVGLPDVVIISPREGVDPGRLARPVLESGRYEKVGEAASFELHVLRAPQAELP